MKTIVARILILIVCFAAVTVASAQQSTELPLTNASVVKLVRAGFKEKTVIAIVNNRPNRFNLEPDKLIELKRNGVSENIILAMLAQNDTFLFSEGDWSTDSMLGRRSGRERAGDENAGGADIFGGSQGSRSQSGGRGTTGGNETSSTTTGSATVRILRPPSEAGGAPLKMEKTPTLNNESVINMVDAGFSEGSIIKRIEDSPADFDLSIPKLTELRRRRVTDTIIAAMTAAMSEGSESRSGLPARRGK